jgi:hypothetical protein
MATLKSIGFKSNKSDPCLLSKWTQDGVIMIGIYVGDCLVIRKRDKFDELIVALKTSGFNLKFENNLTDYLSCQLIENAESKEILIFQPHLINNLEAKFGDGVKAKGFIKLLEHQDLKFFALIMMMTSLNRICRVDTVLESECCRISSSILNLICAMLLGKLSKCMDKATMGTYLEMLRVVNLLLTPKHFVSKFFQKTKLKIGASAYFAIVLGWEILRKESVLLASLFI